MTARVGVVGHVEHVEFCVVDRLPGPGEVTHAREWFAQAGGGGAVAAVQLRKLAGHATFLTALGNDGVARALRAELTGHGVTVHAAQRDRPHRRGFTHLDRTTGERTITIMGERIVPRGADPLPWDELANLDAVYLTAGDAAAVRRARSARSLVATVRAFDAIAEAGVMVDALVASAADETERYDVGRLRPAPRHVIVTDGARGGRYRTVDARTGGWDATPPPGPVADAYGCGDSFAAGLTFGLGAGLDLEAALRLGARCGAHCLAGRGPYAGQLEEAGRDPAQPESARRSAS
jgi:ribokinase